jgi:hypothetical protein
MKDSVAESHCGQDLNGRCASNKLWVAGQLQDRTGGSENRVHQVPAGDSTPGTGSDVARERSTRAPGSRPAQPGSIRSAGIYPIGL